MIYNTVRVQPIAASTETFVPPNRDYLKLTVSKITATSWSASGKNETLTMERISPEEFLLTQGDTGRRWNNKAKTRRYPMARWDEIFSSYRKAGWILFDTEKRKKVAVKQTGMMVGGKHYQPIADPDAASIVSRLISYANQMVEEEYASNIADVPDWAFAEAKKGLDDLALSYEQMSNELFNEKLTHIFAVLPRRIDVMSKYIAAKDATAEDRAKIVEEERDRYDVLHSLLRGEAVSDLTGKETVLQAYGIDLRPFSEEEMETAKKLLTKQAHKLIRGWRVINHKTEDAFTAFCEKEHLTDGAGIDYLFHGSKHQNWWSILTKGLTINPVGVVITGKAYGQGTYFAPDAIKSLGYTDRSGAKWTDGRQNTGFLGLYKVATGNRYNGHLGCDSRFNWEKLQQVQPGAHCTWAECRYSGFLMDEVIVYRDDQSTIWGLLELSA